MNKKLYRSSNDKMISGVCSGFANYYSVDPTLIRIGTVVLLFVTAFFPMIIAYIACAAIMPEKAFDTIEEDVEVLDQDGNKVHSAPYEKKNNKLIGIVLIGFGAFLLLNRFIWWFDHRIFWSLGIVAVGLYILLKDRNNSNENNN